MVDYVRMKETGERLIQKNGRAMKLLRFSTEPTNPEKPWEGNSEKPIEREIYGVAVPPNNVTQFGLAALGTGARVVDLESYGGNVIIVAPQSFDLREFTQLEDYDGTWTIDAVQILRPGDVSLLGFLAVSQ